MDSDIVLALSREEASDLVDYLRQARQTHSAVSRVEGVMQRLEETLSIYRRSDVDLSL